MKRSTLTILFLLVCSASFGQITELVVGMTDPGRMVLNSTHLYYTDDNSVYRLSITQADAVPELLASGFSNANGVALDGDILYIAEFADSKVFMLNINSTPFEVVEFSNANKPNFLLWHDSSLYFSSNTRTSRYVGRFDAPREHKSSTLLAAIAAPSTTFVPFGIAVYNPTTLYIANAGSNTIDVINPTTKDITPQLFLSGFEKPFGLRIYKNILYITEVDGGKISSIDLTAPNPVRTELYSDINDPIDIEVNEMGIFVMNENPNRIILLKNTLSFNEFEKPELKLHPNPSGEYLNVTNIVNTTGFVIYDTFGKIVSKGMLEPNSKIEIKKLATGIYFLHLKNNGPIKFIKL